MNFRTDFAFEEIEVLAELEEYTCEKKTYHDIEMNHIKILKENKLIDKKVGDYITIHLTGLHDQNLRDDALVVLQEALNTLIDKDIQKVLVVGLGNEDVTADSLGPLVASDIVVTSHLFRLEKMTIDEGFKDVSVLVPKVMGQTGIETAIIIQAITEKIKPDLVIVVDALATSSVDRINKVIQVSNTGICPGSGVGNHRLAITQENLKVPVISVGVATVTSVQSLVNQVLEEIESEDIEEAMQYIENTTCFQMVVTPKEMDEDVYHLVEIISSGINHALHKHFDEI